MPTVEEIRKAGCKAFLYADGAGFHMQVYRCVAEPRITVHCRQPRGKARARGVPPTKKFVVDDEREFDTLEEAVAALSDGAAT